MKRLISGLLLTAFGVAVQGPAIAAQPAAFKATGQVHTVTDGDAQDMAITVSYKAGKVRVVTDSRDAGRSIMVAQKGRDTVAMLDPEQKMVVRMNPSAMRSGAAKDDMPQFDAILDPGGFKHLVVKEGKRLGVGGALIGHKTTLYERTRGSTTMKVWLADDLELPLKIEGKSGKGDRFDMKVTSIDLTPTFGKDDFDQTPPGYTEIKAETHK